MSLQLQQIANPRLVAALLAERPEAVLAQIAEATVLVPATTVNAGATAITYGRGAAGRHLLWAFTDAEALSAWDRQRPTTAVAVSASQLSDLVPYASAAVALNPAGPGAHILGGEALTLSARASDPLFDTAPSADLTAPEARTLTRRRASHAHDLGRQHAAAGDLEAAREQLTESIRACAELGDRLHGAAAGIELARCHARAGATERAITLWSRAGGTLALLGDRDLAVSALLDAADAAAAADLTDEAGRLIATVLDILSDTDTSDRLISLWQRLR